VEVAHGDGQRTPIGAARERGLRSGRARGMKGRMSSSVIRQLRVIGVIEGVSFLVLLGIAMPLKYLAGMPRAVSVVGMAHGVLFILYLAALAHAHVTVRWPMRRALTVFAAAMLPLGPFFIEGSLRREQRRLETTAATAAAPRAAPPVLPA